MIMHIVQVHTAYRRIPTVICAQQSVQPAPRRLQRCLCVNESCKPHHTLKSLSKSATGFCPNVHLGSVLLAREIVTARGQVCFERVKLSDFLRCDINFPSSALVPTEHGADGRCSSNDETSLESSTCMSHQKRPERVRYSSSHMHLQLRVLQVHVGVYARFSMIFRAQLLVSSTGSRSQDR